MRSASTSGFLRGLLAGVTLTLVAGLLLLYLLVDLGHGQWLPASTWWRDGLHWLNRNLGLSLLPFTLILSLYLRTLQRLGGLLNRAAPAEQVSQQIQLLDVWISLFFGIGVIWTAIGMRSALLFALGDIDDVARSGAFAVLQRLVEGGILTALSTTIVGGAGGYLMRLGKSATVGARISRYYGEREQRQTARIDQLLSEIRDATRERPFASPESGR